ncbi:Serine/threonine-protein kinase PknB [Stieleria maiorica]|uniref:Serine/threonine-protein kinase PknB n=1 Tax=Stieleria maiorica TaxID=2795974 RepID=A0A5B9MGX3_9BACT|nr:serine/threonine protein kinase [Stieleria maiorica]QEF99376.1 Serine/threonine-protein kinase PknB [Stieleria maiorica]
MDAERYARVRELFLAIDDLPSDQQRQFLASQCGDDQTLIDEVMSLLEEHDRESAQLEGNSAKKPAIPSAIPEAAATASAESAASADSTASAPESDGNASTSHAPFMPGAQRDVPIDASGEQSGAGLAARERHQRRGDFRSGVRKSRPGTKAGTSKPAPLKSSQITQQSSQRTHASPRYRDEEPATRRRPSAGIWQTRATKHRRFNAGWLWLAAILPTALAGWWTVTQVQTHVRQSAATELATVADAVRTSVNQFLVDQARLAQSWARQDQLRAAVVSLVQTSRQEDSAGALRDSPAAITIRQQLIAQSQQPDIKYVVWDRTGRVIASWLPDGADVGGNVAPDGAADLARAMRGETVLFGPKILTADDNGFRPEMQSPVMAEILPIHDDGGRVVATMLIRGFGMYEALDQIFREASGTAGLDVYAVNSAGVMVTNSPRAQTWLVDDGDGDGREDDGRVSCRLRVSDPDTSAASATKLNLHLRRSQPLTYAVAGVASGQSGSQLDPYRNYAGIEVVGTWRWLNQWNLGIVAERTARSAFATARTVQWGFIVLACMLTLTVLIAASRIAKRTAIAQAAVHPLSRYELVAELGSGGMGVVYRAKHGQLGRDTALKVLRGDRDNLEDRLRFDREAKLAASLSNPHTVTIYDYGRGDEGEAYCVMEFLKGITLYDVVARSGFLPYGRALFILRQVCDSLGEAHKLGLVHRDIKPQNIMLSLDASVGDWAVVFDFGLAKPLQPDADSYQTAETIWAGTPMYMAPERYREPNNIDPRSDIYSVGCIAYFLLSGRPPFIECDPESLFALVLTEQPISISVHRDQDVPEEIVAVVKRCMAKSVDDRFATVDELAAELDRLIADYPWSVEEARSWWRIHGSEVG